MTTPSSPKRVLFVCVENANRSQMAQAFARITSKTHAASAPPQAPQPGRRLLGADLAALEPRQHFSALVGSLR